MPESPNDPANIAWSRVAEEDRNAINSFYANIGKSIAAYETRLVTPPAPFDEFVADLKAGREDSAAISESAKRGLKIFIGRGECRLCHSGPIFTDSEFHNTRVAPAGGGPLRDSGRFEGIKQLLADPFNARSSFRDGRDDEAVLKLDLRRDAPENWGQFKTPTLRNVAKTAPYMSQGQFPTLRQVLHHYSTFENAMPAGHHGETILRPLKFTQQEVDDLLAFFDSLTSPLPDESLLAAPR